ncbi:MFS transporter [Devosia nitrariae]|uniref:MFS transporter n=1 Tax=Devosia nitrariae TaxID=2071872 RepID=A0ABQ5W1Z4_9HYPH|nr:MFS transporter [Devosia nitrariae]GLQ53834.1 MFS transporter [Devosia nitrariae]
MSALTASGDVERYRSGTTWGAVICMSLLTFVLIASEFMPVSLLTPIAQELGTTEGQAGQAIAISGLFAIVTSLFGNSLLSHFDRRTVVLSYSGLIVISGLTVALAPNYAIFMVGRALLGVAIGGFWSLSTAILARLTTSADLPKALAMLQGGTAFAAVIAAPLGSYLGGLIGWRGAFLIVVPAGIVGFVWQLAVLPKMPPERQVSVGAMIGLFRRPVVALGMAATTLAFMGQFALTTYLRPFLEGVTGLDVNVLSLALLGLGLGGLAGTAVIGFVARTHLNSVLIGLPVVLAVLAVSLVLFGHVGPGVAALLILWGLFTAPTPVAWGTWMTRVIPGELEAGGGLQVALIQGAITAGAFTGGLLFDTAGWSSTFLFAAGLLGVASLLALLTTRRELTN